MAKDKAELFEELLTFARTIAGADGLDDDLALAAWRASVQAAKALVGGD